MNCPLINCLKCTTENVFLHENYVEMYILANTERFERGLLHPVHPYLLVMMLVSFYFGYPFVFLFIHTNDERRYYKKNNLLKDSARYRMAIV